MKKNYEMPLCEFFVVAKAKDIIATSGGIAPGATPNPFYGGDDHE